MVYFPLNIALNEEDSQLVKSWDVRFDLQPDLNCVCRCSVKWQMPCNTDTNKPMLTSCKKARDVQFCMDRIALEYARIM